MVVSSSPIAVTQSFVVYEFAYPSRGANHVGKTKGTLHERCVELAWSDDQNSIVNNNFNQCADVQLLPIYVQHYFQIITILGVLSIEFHASVWF